ncbi:MAG: type II secretion system minor pseudopilin GspJ [Acidiferrobacterales bacterium]|nr:type II secretion system minor pseudopilin GspJ [Acidiferrobacterales bacterium]
MLDNAKKNGFTLIEIVVAVAIFAVITSIVFPALMQFLEMRERVMEKNSEVIGLQKTFLFLAKDLRYAANRLSKDDYGDLNKTTFSIGDESLLSFSAVYPDLSLQGQGVPRRVQWKLEENILMRVQYPVMDPDPETRLLEQSLLQDVEEVSIQVHKVTDGRDSFEKKWDEPNRLPDMIDVEIVLDTGIKYRRVFTMLGGDPTLVQGQIDAKLKTREETGDVDETFDNQ